MSLVVNGFTYPDDHAAAVDVRRGPGGRAHATARWRCGMCGAANHAEVNRSGASQAGLPISSYGGVAPCTACGAPNVVMCDHLFRRGAEDRRFRRTEVVYSHRDAADCALATAAYIANYFRSRWNHAGIDDVRRWCAQTRKTPAMFPIERAELPGAYIGQAERASTWYLREDGEAWVRTHLTMGQIAFAVVHAGHPTLMHAVACIGADDHEVLLVDPEQGATTWSWPRFLGVDMDSAHRHHVEAWVGAKERR